MGTMHGLFIRLVNLGFLIVILLGIPAITGRNIGWLRLSNSTIAQNLTLGGLALAGVANGIGMLVLRRDAKKKKLHGQWLILFLVLFSVEYLLIHRQINFNWLKEFLLWAKAKVLGGNR